MTRKYTRYIVAADCEVNNTGSGEAEFESYREALTVFSRLKGQCSRATLYGVNEIEEYTVIKSF